MPPTRVVHCKREPFDVMIDRSTKWGNVFWWKSSTHPRFQNPEFKVANREEAIARYREWLPTQAHLMAALPELSGKVLGCWCHKKSCHGHVLIEFLHQMGYE